MSAIRRQPLRLVMADSRSSSSSSERPLSDALQASKREGPVWIGEQPLIAARCAAVPDPLRTFATDRYPASQCGLLPLSGNGAYARSKVTL